MDKVDKAIERLKLGSDMSLRYYGKPLMITYSGGNETARKLATQAYGKNDAWSAFADFVYSVVGVYALYPECTDEEFEELFKWLGFEIEEGEDG